MKAKVLALMFVIEAPNARAVDRNYNWQSDVWEMLIQASASPRRWDFCEGSRVYLPRMNMS
jgi:hypothetical protein